MQKNNKQEFEQEAFKRFLNRTNENNMSRMNKLEIKRQKSDGYNSLNIKRVHNV